jgi:hypothetical protein
LFNNSNNIKTVKDVRKHFFKDHNAETIYKGDSFHLAIPYKITLIENEKIIGRIYFLESQIVKPSQIEEIFKLEDFPEAKLEDIIIKHLLPVDYLSKEEFNNYKDYFIL